LNNFTKLGLVAGLIALLLWGAKAAQRAASNFQFDIVGYGKPALAGTFLTVPLQIKYTNPTSIPIVLDQLIGDIYINKNGTFVLAAKVNQPVSIQPGTSIQWLSPTLDLQNVFGGNLLNTLSAFQQILTNKQITLRSDITAIFKGIALPKQTFTNEIALA